MIKLNTFDYIKQLEEENKLLKHRLLEEMQMSNRLIMSEKIKNEQLAKENIYLKQKNSLLSLLTR